MRAASGHAYFVDRVLSHDLCRLLARRVVRMSQCHHQLSASSSRDRTLPAVGSGSSIALCLNALVSTKLDPTGYN